MQRSALPPDQDRQAMRACIEARVAALAWPALVAELDAQGGEAAALHGPDFGGNGGVVLGNLLQAGFGLPVGLLQLAVGGTAVAQWQAGASCWLNLVGMLTADSGTDFEYALWHQGESDVSAGTAQAAYRAGLRNVVAQTRALSGRATLPFGIAITGRRAGGPDGYDMVRRVQRDVIAQDAHAFFAGSALDSVLVDGIHWDAPSYERMARRYAQAVLAVAGLAANPHPAARAPDRQLRHVAARLRRQLPWRRAAAGQPRRFLAAADVRGDERRRAEQGRAVPRPWQRDRQVGLDPARPPGKAVECGASDPSGEPLRRWAP